MKVRPTLLWLLIVASALVGALTGIVFEGLLDKYLMLAATLSKYGIVGDIGRMEEVLSTVIGAALGTVFVGLTAFVIYKVFLYTRRE